MKRILFACVLPALASCSSTTVVSPVGPTELPGVPLLVSPADGAVLDNGCRNREDGIAWDFDWSDLQNATRYHLRVEHAGASIPVIDTFTTESSYLRVEAGAYIIERNRFAWQWKVEAEVDGVFHGYSATRTFSVEPLDADCF